MRSICTALDLEQDQKNKKTGKLIEKLFNIFEY